MFGYIYKTTNLINGKIYVGQHKSNVFDAHYKGSCVRLADAFAKYGKDNFIVELIVKCESKHEMDEREKEWIKKLNSRDRTIGYNLSEGGERGFYLENHDYQKNVETRRKNGTLSGWKKSQESIQQGLETKRQKYGDLSNIGMKGKHHSEETRRKMSELSKGRVISEQQKLQISNTLKEYNKDENVRKRNSETLKKLWQDPSFREKMKNRKKPDGKKISETLKKYNQEKKNKI